MKSIADVVSGSGLAFYAEVALILFAMVFVAVTIRVFSSDARDLDEAARLPLDDDDLEPTATTATHGPTERSAHDDA